MEDRRVAYRVLVWRPVRNGLFERPKSGREDSNKKDMQNVGWCARTGLIWLMIMTGSFEFHKRPEICRLANDLLPFQEVFCSM